MEKGCTFRKTFIDVSYLRRLNRVLRYVSVKVELKIDNISMERVYENTFLGVSLDHKICWELQIKHVKATLAKTIAILI